MNLQYYQPSGDKWLIVRRGDCPFTRKVDLIFILGY